MLTGKGHKEAFLDKKIHMIEYVLPYIIISESKPKCILKICPFH